MGLCSTPEVQTPDPYSEISQGYQADIALMPFRKKIDDAAVRGEKVTINGKTYDFTGLGQADYQKAYADAMAQAQLEIQKQYGADFIKQRQEELNIADPEGQAARKDLYNRILEDLGAAKNPDANATQLQSSILAELEKGGQLSPEAQNQVQQQVLGQQVKRGNFLGNAAATQEAGAMADASAAQKQSRQARAMAMLQSGSTPEDIQYRKTQQSLANLSSFLKGETPTSQFGQLSAAGNGAVPFTGYQSGNYFNNNAGSQNAAFAGQIAGIQNQVNSQQSNPWLAGLSMGFNGLGAWSSLGGKIN